MGLGKHLSVQAAALNRESDSHSHGLFRRDISLGFKNASCLSSPNNDE